MVANILKGARVTALPTDPEEGALYFVKDGAGTPRLYIAGSDGKLFELGVQAGTLAFHAGQSAPAGWLTCNGAAISRTAYAALFAAIGTTSGAGDGSTTFNIPDLRGEFMRGADMGRGADLGRVIGTWQAHDWKAFYGTDTISNASTGYSHGPVYFGKSTTSYVGNLFTGSWANPSAGIGIMWDSTSEIRPRNRAFIPVIKY